MLYKYMTFSAAEAVLRNNTIGFAKPNTFNDPFELEAGYPTEECNLLERPFSAVRNWGKRFTWTDTSGVLSLTRNPINPLMWAHYGDEHKGVVVGIDIETAGFFDEKSCLIPAQFGNVIYTNTRPTHPLIKNPDCETLYIGHTFHYPHDHAEELQRLFLHKPSYWSYEEEVRVVKCLSNSDFTGEKRSEGFTEIELPNKTLYGFQLPEGSIKEIYFGMRHDYSQYPQDNHQNIENLNKDFSDIVFKKCYLPSDSWNVEVLDLVTK
jgi:hypothetical protein